MATQDYDSSKQGSVIEGKRRAWRRNFNGTTLNPDFWTVSKSAGMTVNVATGTLTVNMNTNINEETIITSTEGFYLPFRVQWSHNIAQRIVNQEVYLEVVNAAGNTYAGILFDGTVNTQYKTTHANGGNSNPASPTGLVSAGVSGAVTIREIEARLDEVDFNDRAVDSAAQAFSRVVKTRTTLDPDEKYYIRMRFKNLGTAPASNTVNTFDYVLVQDTNDVLAEISGGRGNTTASRSMPVMVSNTPAVSISGTPTQNIAAGQAVGLTASATVGTATTMTRLIGVTNASQSIKASAGRLFGAVLVNPGAAAVYVNFYNVLAPTIGTTQPNLQVLVPAGQSFDVEQTLGIAFGTGITVAATDTSVPLSAVAPATAVTVNAFWL